MRLYGNLLKLLETVSSASASALSAANSEASSASSASSAATAVAQVSAAQIVAADASQSAANSEASSLVAQTSAANSAASANLAQQAAANSAASAEQAHTVSLNNGTRFVSGVTSLSISFDTGTNIAATAFGNIQGLRTRQFSGGQDEIRIDVSTSYHSSVSGQISTSTTTEARTRIPGGTSYGSVGSETIFLRADGLPTSRRDSHNVVTTYVYDRFGNLTNTIMSNNNSSLRCSLSSNFQETGEHMTQSWDTRNSVNRPQAASATDTEFSSPAGVLSRISRPPGHLQVQSKNTTEFEYDEFNEQLRSVSTSNSRNDILYNAQGRIQRLQHNNGVGYDLGYDTHGNINSVSQLGISKQFDYLTSGNQELTTYTNSSNNIFTQHENYDRYGFNHATHTVVNGATAQNTVQAVFSDRTTSGTGSSDRVSHASQVRSISDRFDRWNADAGVAAANVVEPSQTTFVYNQDDKLMGYNVRSHLTRSSNGTTTNVVLRVEEQDNESAVEGQSGFQPASQHRIEIREFTNEDNGTIRYRFSGENRTWTDNHILSPRLRHSQNYSFMHGGTPLYIDTRYNYDGLGRINSAPRDFSQLHNITRTYNNNLTYEQGGAGTTEMDGWYEYPTAITLDELNKLLIIMQENDIPLPELEPFQKYQLDFNPLKKISHKYEAKAWGPTFDGKKEFSKILN